MTAEPFEYNIRLKSSPAHIFRAFTRPMGWQEWFCDIARCNPIPGGAVYFSWNSGFYAAGQYTSIDPEKELSFTWMGRGDPAPTQVQVWIIPDGNDCTLKLIHSGFGMDPLWDEARHQIDYGWKKSLENLVSTQETGADLRITNRVMMGIYPVALTKEFAAEHSLAVEQGIYLQNVIEGRSAAKAGLQNDDILIELASQPVQDIPTLVRILHAHKIGEIIDIQYYRGKRKHHTKMELFPVPLPTIPNTPVELAESLRAMYAKNNSLLSEVFSEKTDADAGYHFDPNEWSAKDTLAHLIHVERTAQLIIANNLSDLDLDYTENHPAAIQGTVSAYPGLKDLLQELMCAETETVAFISALPEHFVNRKSSFWRLAYTLITLPDHTIEHIQQIRKALEKAAEEAA